MKVSIIGRIGYDLFARETGVQLDKVKSFSRYLGGSAANTAVGLSRLGISCRILNCLGDDPLSDFLVDYLRSQKIDVREIQRKPGWLPSFCLTEISPPDGFEQVFYRDRPADTQFEIDPVAHREMITRSPLLITNGTSLCASPSRESTFRALEWAARAGVPTALDVDYREMSWNSPEEAALYIRLALPWTRILIGNPEELCLVTDCRRVEQAIAQLRELRVPLLVAKLGASGVQVYSESEALEIEPFPVEVASTIGAGDGFAAGFLAAWLKQAPLADALRQGNAAAALVVSQPMCSDAMPTSAEINALFERFPGVRARQIHAPCSPGDQ